MENELGSGNKLRFTLSLRKISVKSATLIQLFPAVDYICLATYNAMANAGLAGKNKQASAHVFCFVLMFISRKDIDFQYFNILLTSLFYL